MIIIDPDGLFGGDRLRRCSNGAQLHFPRLLLATDGFARLELNYARIAGKAYATFTPVPGEAELYGYLHEYAANFLLFPYEAGGTAWGQFDCRPELMPRYKTSADRRSPAPPEPAFTQWKKRYRDQNKSLPKCFGNSSEWTAGANRNGMFAKEEVESQFRNCDVANTESTGFPKSSGKVSETFPCAVAVAVADKHICASQDDARVGCDSQSSIDDPPFETTSPEALFPVEVIARKSPKAVLENWQAERFEEFWAVYWRRRDRKNALGAFRRHVRTSERFEGVMAALTAQAPEMLGRDPAKRPYAATWLNGERWQDEPETEARPPKAESSDDYPELTA